MQRIVVFAGMAGHGKDTAGHVLVENGFTRAPLAGPLKAMIGTLLWLQAVSEGHQRRMLEGDLKETPDPALGGATPRRAMQLLGTEWGRALSPTLWLDTWRRYHGGRENFNLVVTDCRFANEAAYLKEMGAEVYLVRRPGFVGGAGQHSSEDLSWASDAEVLWNDFSTPEEFQDSIRARFFT